MLRNGTHHTTRLDATIDRTVLAGLVVLFGVIVWRAASQAITYDEAFTWLAFARGSLGEVFTRYTANNHVLYTLLAWTSTHGLGVSELTLRLPSIAAGAAYLGVARALAGVLSEAAAGRALVTAALVLNPFVLDFLVAARGYGLATTALLVALWQVLTWPDLPRLAARRALGVGLALGIGLASNLSVAFPAAGVVTASAAVSAMCSPRPLRRALRVAAGAGGIAAAIPAALMARPLQEEHPGFYYGAETFAEASRSLVAASLQFDDSRWQAPDGVVEAIALAAAPLLLALCGVSGCALLFAALRGAARHGAVQGGAASALPLAIVGTTIAVAALARAVAHLAADVPLPMNRTGLYWLPLFVLGIAACRRALGPGTGGLRLARRTCDAVLAGLVLAFLAQFNATHFREWKFDAGSRDIFEIVEAWPCPAERPRRLTTTPWLYEPALEFYRVVRQADHVTPLNVEREQYEPGDADFYVVRTAPEVEALTEVAAPVMTDPISGATLVVDRTLVSCAT